MNHFSITGSYTDLYQLTMGEVYFKKGISDRHAVFDYFFRKLPYAGGYAVFAGLSDVLDVLRDLQFTEDDLHFLREIGLSVDFVEHLKNFTFKGTIYSSKEGDIVFPVRPVLRVEGTLLETQVIETFLLNFLNFQTLVATKAARMKWAAGMRTLSEFGLRRSQATGGYYATRAAIIGGFDSTSNVKSAKDHDLKAMGTMAHSFVQTHEDELTAFRSYADARPDDCLLLVDTYDTLKSGIPNAITVALELREKGHELIGIRLDSGDLAYLSKRARLMLDNAGLPDVKIAASNQLDEYVIQSLLNQRAPIDIFGVGTSLVTGSPDAALDGVYKLAFSGDEPRIKLSESIKKVTLPDRKQVFRIYDTHGQWLGADAVTLDNEHEIKEMYDPFEPGKSIHFGGCPQETLLEKVMDKGKVLIQKQELEEIALYSQQRLALLPDEYKRFQNPHIYKVGISKKLMDLRNELKNKYK